VKYFLEHNANEGAKAAHNAQTKESMRKLSKGAGVKHWNAAENDSLSSFAQETGHNWTSVAAQMNDKFKGKYREYTPDMCKTHFCKMPK
jgi:hypothetical protein